MKRLFIILFMFLIGLPVNSQLIERISINGQDKVNFQFYRGIVEIEGTESGEITIIQNVYDYDVFESTGKLISKNEELEGRAKLDIKKTKKEISVSNSGSRNIQFLKISIPKTLEVDIVIQHYGEVSIRNTSSPIVTEIFEGKIQAKINNTLLATVIRKGSIRVDVSKGNNTKFLMVNTYDGDIEVNLPRDFSAVIKATSDLGSMINNLDVNLEENKGGSFTQKDNSETQTLSSKIFSGVLGKGQNKISIQNVKGLITLNQI